MCVGAKIVGNMVVLKFLFFPSALLLFCHFVIFLFCYFSLDSFVFIGAKIVGSNVVSYFSDLPFFCSFGNILSCYFPILLLIVLLTNISFCNYSLDLFFGSAGSGADVDFEPSVLLAVDSSLEGEFRSPVGTRLRLVRFLRLGDDEGRS